MVRPIKPVDENEIYKLAKIHCTNQEIASMCDISVDTLEERYSAVLKKGRDEGKSSLRRQQMRLIEECNSAPMAIWLGKVYLKQKEELHMSVENMPTPRIPEAAVSMKKDND